MLVDIDNYENVSFDRDRVTMNFTMERRFDLQIRITPVHSVYIREQMHFL